MLRHFASKQMHQHLVLGAGLECFFFFPQQSIWSLRLANIKFICEHWQNGDKMKSILRSFEPDSNVLSIFLSFLLCLSFSQKPFSSADTDLMYNLIIVFSTNSFFMHDFHRKLVFFVLEFVAQYFSHFNSIYIYMNLSSNRISSAHTSASSSFLPPTLCHTPFGMVYSARHAHSSAGWPYIRTHRPPRTPPPSVHLHCESFCVYLLYFRFIVCARRFTSHTRRAYIFRATYGRTIV